jgi:hypothetical protein
MGPVPTVPTAVLVAAVAMACVVVLGTRCRLGPESDWVEVVRAVTLPLLDPFVERLAGGVGAAYQLGERERVGILAAPPEAVERRLWRAGCRRNVLSASKTLADGRRQVGAWVYRGDAVAANRQVDVMLFDGPNRTTAVYAHEEFSSALPWPPAVATLRKHYRGVDYDPDEGAAVLTATILPEARWVERG